MGKAIFIFLRKDKRSTVCNPSFFKLQSPQNLFRDRVQAGRQLSKLLLKYKAEKPMVLALPRGGVVVGYEVSKKLKAPFSVIVSRKIPAPQSPEYGVGAVSEGAFYINRQIVKEVGLNKDQLAVLIKLGEDEVKRRVKLFRRGKKLPNLREKTVILIDDGLATGGTAFAAIDALKKLGAKRIIFSAPVCDRRTAKKLEGKVEFVECLSYPELSSVGSYYLNFEQVTDEEVVKILEKER